MQPTLRLCSARAHQPLIKFLGKRSWPSTHPEQHPHPQAPAEVKERFGDFLKRFNSTSSGSSSSTSSGNESAFPNFWEAPERIWRPRNSQLQDSEIEAIMSGGATL